MKETPKTQKSFLRPPIVTVLGHVDHGKTTLLDYIRSTSVAKKEAGGITQKIGASVVETKASGQEGIRPGGKITFIDTPGHAVFSNMRSRGTKLADIAVLVVASDDGVKPQTKEALEYIFGVGIPFIVAATKIDLASAQPDRVKDELEKMGVKFEGKGGDTPFVKLSAKSGEGVDNLLEIINLVAEMHDISADPKNPLEAVVIETGKDKRGPTVSVVLKDGCLLIGDEVVTETQKAKVRGLFDHRNNPVKSVGPGEPVLILGFSNLPLVGSKLKKLSQDSVLELEAKDKIPEVKSDEGEIAIVLKTQSAGSLEAIRANLPKEVIVIFSGVGEVVESDIFLAKSADALILSFESKVNSNIMKLAEMEGVTIETFDVVYEIFEKLKELIEKGQLEILGRAEIIAKFPFNSKSVAGCKILLGKISKTDSLLLIREEKEIGQVKITSMRKGRENIELVKQGEECGIIFSPQLDFKIGDVILSVRNN